MRQSAGCRQGGIGTCELRGQGRPGGAVEGGAEGRGEGFGNIVFIGGHRGGARRASGTALRRQ